MAKLSQGLGFDETVFDLLSRIRQSIRRQPTKALGRTTPVEGRASGHGNLRQRAGEMRADVHVVIGRDNCGPRSSADRTASHTASPT
ncbi:hypothetical protein ACVWXO_010604 [Bradyrhizobium sp. LM2.7]